MATAIVLDHKALWLIVQAMKHRIAAEDARYEVDDRELDDAGDYGNDLAYLKVLHAEFVDRRDNGPWATHVFQCWRDPSDCSITLFRYERVAECRAKGLLSDESVLEYLFAADTFEEAMAIHHLRQGWEPYQPIGDAAPCPSCGAVTYPGGSAECWRCGPDKTGGCKHGR